MTQSYDFNNYEKDALTKPRDKAWENWAKFEAVGAKVQGFIRDVFFRQGEGQFADQRGLTLEQPDGTLINVGIKHIDFVLAKTNTLRLGDPVTIVFEKEIPATVKGHSATKQFGFYGTNIAETEGQKTVLQLENEDRKIVEAEAAANAEAEAKANAEFEGEAPAAGGDAPAAPADNGLPFESPSDQPAAPTAAPASAAPAAPAAPTAAAPEAPAAPTQG